MLFHWREMETSCQKRNCIASPHICVCSGLVFVFTHSRICVYTCVCLRTKCSRRFPLPPFPSVCALPAGSATRAPIVTRPHLKGSGKQANSPTFAYLQNFHNIDWTKLSPAMPLIKFWTSQQAVFCSRFIGLIQLFKQQCWISTAKKFSLIPIYSLLRPSVPALGTLPQKRHSQGSLSFMTSECEKISLEHDASSLFVIFAIWLIRKKKTYNCQFGAEN